jgi:hypothetical protein
MERRPGFARPEPDIAARADILARLSAAQQKVAGAELATASVGHVLDRANAKAATLEAEVPALVAGVLIEEGHLLLPAIIEATMALAKAQGRYATLRKFLLERAEAAGDAAMRNGFFRSLETLDREAADAARIGPLLSFDAGSEWRDLARELGDTAARPTPTLPAAFPGMPQSDGWVND